MLDHACRIVEVREASPIGSWPGIQVQVGTERGARDYHHQIFSGSGTADIALQVPCFTITMAHGLHNHQDRWTLFR